MVIIGFDYMLKLAFSVSIYEFAKHILSIYPLVINGTLTVLILPLTKHSSHDDDHRLRKTSCNVVS